MANSREDHRGIAAKGLHGFKKLHAWQKAHALTLEVYKVAATLPKAEVYGLTAQMQRAAVSVPANIAEGYGRQHTKDYIRFLTIARGSLAELETCLMLSKDLGYLVEPTFAVLDDLRDETARLLTGLIKSLEATSGN